MSTDLAYPGARPFSREYSGKFFGRTDEAAELSAIWLRSRLTYISGPSGVGKTSLLAAGVLPLVNRHNVDLLPVGGFSKGASSPDAPPGQYTPYTLALLRSWSADGQPPRVDPFTIDEFIARRAEQRDPSVAMLAAIDQADDVFAGPGHRQPHRQRFMRELADALQHPSLHLLICVRDDALPQFTAALGEGTRIQLQALRPDQAQRAIEGPGFFDQRTARELVESIRTSRIVAPGAHDRDVIADRVEPALLQVVCARFWEMLHEHTARISQRELRRSASVDALLSAHCGGIISAVAAIHGMTVPELRFWLVSTFVASAGGCQDVTEAALRAAGQPATVARVLEDRHLLRGRAGQSAGSRIYRFIADRVIEPLRHAPDDLPSTGDPKEHLLAGERALTAGEASLAERYAELARQAAPETDLILHGKVRSLLGNVAREQGELDQAEAHYRAAVSLFEAALQHATVALLLAAIGRTLIARGALDAGVRELAAAVRRAPTDSTIQTELSAAVQELGWRLPGGQRPRISPG
jgi:hypothetical protein